MVELVNKPHLKRAIICLKVQNTIQLNIRRVLEYLFLVLDHLDQNLHCVRAWFYRFHLWYHTGRERELLHKVLVIGLKKTLGVIKFIAQLLFKPCDFFQNSRNVFRIEFRLFTLK